MPESVPATREYLRRFRRDRRLEHGDFFPDERLNVRAGQDVGVVLLGPGGPETREDMASYLYRLYMDPAVGVMGGSGWLRHQVSRWKAWRGANRLHREYDAIGGRAPVVRHAAEQARALRMGLDRRFAGSGVRFTTYSAMRYGEASAEKALGALAAAGIRDVILVPLHPQYHASTTGSALAWWSACAAAAELSLNAVGVREYATDERLIQALNERVDEGLQRFPRDLRKEVRYVFVGQGGAGTDARASGCTYCCQVHATVDAVMALRGYDRPFAVAFQGRTGLAGSTDPRLSDVLSDFGDDGTRAVLAIPVSIVTEQIDIAYRLDVTMRSVAERSGIGRYEVAAPLDCHPLLIDALTHVVGNRLVVDGEPLSDDQAPVKTTLCPRGTWTANELSVQPELSRCAGCPNRHIKER